MARTPNPLLVATTEAVSKLSLTEFQTMVNDAFAYATDHAAKITVPDDYPCGFAQLSIKLRKNGKYAKILQDSGFKWDDFYKNWYLRGGTFINYQNVYVKEAILDEAAKAFEAHGVPVYVSTRLD